MNLPTRERIDRPGDESLDQQNEGQLRSSFNKLSESDDCLQQNGSVHCEDVPELTTETEKDNIPRSRSFSHSREDLDSLNEPEIDSEFCGDKTCRSLQLGNGDKSDDVSETSMVDSISALDISPDDIVGIIVRNISGKQEGQLSNSFFKDVVYVLDPTLVTFYSQQRLFAWQVFELHRLIKVQRLIAASPNLLLQDITYLGKHSTKVSPAEKLPSQYVVAPPVHVAKRKGDCEKPNHKMECSAENAVGKTSLSSVKSGSQPSNYGSYIGNPLPVPVSTDPKVGPWCFHHSLGHQWLIPLMSPSEGLVYKPYTAPGFMGSPCGGCAPFGPTPLNGSFMNPAYGIPASHPHHQGTGPSPFVPPGVHCYFPPYGMPVMNPGISCSAVEQMNYFAGSGLYGQTGQLSGGGANFNMQHQSSCNVPTQKSIPQVTKFQASKDTELLGSTASSPSEKTQGVGLFNLLKEEMHFHCSQWLLLVQKEPRCLKRMTSQEE
ncbi:hypothetical protein GH714_030624 [Hevea brasiliensis]|uniref:Uncharacterized protein n=1 Tax=Hevea brasiliensis TaxID=3981 RepID=A0A6A6LTN3_HEVBR|nr:hypothetical protein GH714_030624 [Hevea brasiliensis]